MSILIYGMKKGKFCHQFSNFTIPPSMKIHKNEVKFKNWICQNFFPENKMDVNLQYKSKGGKSLTLKTLPQQMFRIVTFHVDHTVNNMKEESEEEIQNLINDGETFSCPSTVCSRFLFYIILLYNILILSKQLGCCYRLPKHFLPFRFLPQ